MGEVATQALRARSRSREARLERARQRWLALDPRRAEREARIAAAVDDVLTALDERTSALSQIEAAEQRVGDAVARLVTEGLSLSQLAQLCGVSRSLLARWKVKAGRRTGGGPTGDRPAVQGTQ
jgi:AraC-like DNA-binding protein